MLPVPLRPTDHRATLDALPVSVFRLDRDLRLTYANARACWGLGRTVDEVIGHDCRELGQDPEYWRPWNDVARRVLETGEPTGFEYAAVVHGAERFVQFLFAPDPPGPDGKPTGVLVVATANDEVRRLRGTVREQDERFGAFMDHGPMLAWMRDAAGRYVYVNAAYLTHYAITAADVIGKTATERWPADVAGQLLASDEKVLETGKALRVYEQAPDVDGTTHTWLNVKFPVADAAGVRFVGGVGIDVTDRVRAEQAKQDLERQLLQAQKLESLGAFAGGLAHDFNNLLRVILGNAGLGLRNLRPDAPAAEHLRQIEQAARQASELCRQMLEVAGRGRVAARDVDLADLVGDVAGMFAPVVPAGTAVNLQLPPDLPPVRGDAGQLRQVVLNLLTNALDAIGPETGTVRVCAGPVSADDPVVVRVGLPAGRYVVLNVTDTGGGMDEATQARVFDPFFTTKPHGRGLGLAAVQGIVRGHRGAITVESRPGRGTTFRVYLPVAAGPSWR